MPGNQDVRSESCGSQGTFAVPWGGNWIRIGGYSFPGFKPREWASSVFFFFCLFVWPTPSVNQGTSYEEEGRHINSSILTIWCVLSLLKIDNVYLWVSADSLTRWNFRSSFLLFFFLSFPLSVTLMGLVNFLPFSSLSFLKRTDPNRPCICSEVGWVNFPWFVFSLFDSSSFFLLLAMTWRLPLF